MSSQNGGSENSDVSVSEISSDPKKTIGTEILKPTENYQSISISWKWTWYENLLWESTTAGKESRKLAVVTVIIVI